MPRIGTTQSKAHIAKRMAARSLKQAQITEKIRAALTGRPLSVEHRRKISETLKNKIKNGQVQAWGYGRTVPNYKGGISSPNELARKSTKAKLWRQQIFHRDDFRCFDCGVRGGALHAHHLYPFAQFPRLRYDLNNGVTLCTDCHKQTDSYGKNIQTLCHEESRPF